MDAPNWDSLSPAPPTTAPTSTEEAPSWDSLSAEKPEATTGQKVGGTLEAVGRGLLGPLVPYAESKLYEEHDIQSMSPEAQQARKESIGPVGAGLGEAAGFIGGTMTGVSEAALLGKAGNIAKGIAGFGEATQLARVGSAAAQQAVEMGLLQAGDELSKKIMNDPDSSAEQAIGNIGLATALGGGAGAFVTGAISPLWKATLGPKVEGMLKAFNSQANGASAVLPEATQKAVEALGVDPHPVMIAAMSGDKDALKMAQTLYRNEDPKFMAALNDLRENTAKSVVEKMGVPLEDTLSFSAKTQGDELAEMVKKDISDKYGPIHAEQQAKQAERFKIEVPEDDIIQAASEVHIAGHNESISSDYRKMYIKAAEDLLEKKSVGGLDSLSSELSSKAARAEGTERYHLGKIADMIDDLADSQIKKQAEEAAGKYGKTLGESAIRDAQIADANYKDYATKMRGLTRFLGMKDFKGTGTLLSKLDHLTAEQIIKKFATKGDVDGAKFLNETFPEIAAKVREYEAKQFLSKSVKEVAGKPVLNTNGLSKRIADLKKGSPEYVDYVMPKPAQDAIEASQHIHDSIAQITNVKNSGTPAGLIEKLRNMGSGAAGIASWLSGHGPIGSAAASAVAHVLSAAPDHVRFAMLKHLGTDAAVNPAAFKATVDMITQIAKGEAKLNKAVEGVFKSGATHTIYTPRSADIAKLDKLVAKNETDPHDLGKKFAEHGSNGVGHYMPTHQIALAGTTQKAVAYLQSIKPHPVQLNPLDKPIEPSHAEQARYDRALTIAENPLVIIDHINKGTLMPNDIKDLDSMYPAMRKQMVQKIGSEMAKTHQNEEPIPYGTRLSLSLFMGAPLDSTMKPESIMAAQPIPKPAPQPPKGSPSKVSSKSSNSYKTPSQEAESDRSSRD